MISFLRRPLAIALMALLSSTFTAASLFAQGADFDNDLDVDNFDLTLLLNNYGIFGGSQFTGDADGDADVDSSDFQVARAEFDFMGSVGGAGSAGGASPEPNLAKLLYNPANGALLLDQTNAQGGVITSFILQSTLAFNIVNPISYPFSSDPVFAKNLAMRTTSVIAQTDPFALNSPTGFPSNPHNLGAMLPPGLNLAGLQSLSLSGVYLGAVANAVGTPVGQPGGRLHAFQLVVVPEPAAATLSAIVAASLFAARRPRRPRPRS